MNHFCLKLESDQPSPVIIGKKKKSSITLLFEKSNEIFHPFYEATLKARFANTRLNKNLFKDYFEDALVNFIYDTSVERFTMVSIKQFAENLYLPRSLVKEVMDNLMQRGIIFKRSHPGYEIIRSQNRHLFPVKTSQPFTYAEGPYLFKKKFTQTVMMTIDPRNFKDVNWNPIGSSMDFYHISNAVFRYSGDGSLTLNHLQEHFVRNGVGVEMLKGLQQDTKINDLEHVFNEMHLIKPMFSSARIFRTNLPSRFGYINEINERTENFLETICIEQSAFDLEGPIATSFYYMKPLDFELRAKSIEKQLPSH